MASKRCLPTRFFKDADIMNVSKDAQLILVGLVLLADDEGRELAHPRLLSREIDYPPEQIEAALQELMENDLVVLYQGGKHRYYSLTRWSQWQSLSTQKITPSRYPAPPQHAEVAQASQDAAAEGVHMTESSRNFPHFPREIPGK
jgi:DNA-binding transcriptional ArsR family regulator